MDRLQLCTAGAAARSNEQKESLQRAARREFEILETLRHPGIRMAQRERSAPAPARLDRRRADSWPALAGG